MTMQYNAEPMTSSTNKHYTNLYIIQTNTCVNNWQVKGYDV